MARLLSKSSYVEDLTGRDGWQVCITDKENTVPLVQQNIDENAELLASRGACARAEVLNWFAPALGEGVLAAGPYDLVVVSDVFYEVNARIIP